MHPIVVGIALISVALVGCSSGIPRPDPDISGAQRLLSLDETMEIPSFPANGSTKIDQTIDGHKTAVYVVGAVKGQTLTIQMQNDAGNVYFDVLEPNGSGKKIFSTEAACRGARIRAPSDATYVIRPFLPRAMADAQASARYSLCITRCEPGKCQGVESNQRI